MSSKGIRTSHLAVLILVFADLTGFGMIIPDIQLRAEALGAPGWLIGVCLSTMFVCQSICAPLWGFLADRFGRKRVIIACTCLSAAGMLVYSQAGTLFVIFASRILSGLGSANVAVAQASLAAEVREEDRTQAMGQVGAAVTAGLIIGPSVGGILASAGGVFWLGLSAGACSLVGVLAFAILMPNRHSRPVADPKGSPWRAVRSDRTILTLLFVAAVGWFGLACLEGTFGRLIEHRLGLGQLAFGLIFAFESLLSFLVQSFAIRFLARWTTDRTLVVFGMAAQGLGLAAMPFCPNISILVVAATVYSIGSGVAGPALNGWAAKATPSDRQGVVFGLMQSARSLGFVVGPTVGGMMFDRNPAGPYLFAGALYGLTVAIVFAFTANRTW